ncbi:beclin 1-associated autophagy-related key regulator isoform X1 [Helicoverpa armigera]|uniref:beclin 1-associated autophagy-related key regulator isoform X1 n=1 Tax=Helicoverpa armigera TaxID=29058 RepID=UPI0030836DB6
MALSFFNESEAPRDFRVSSTESDGHYKKCLLCYTVKKNFYCSDCVRAGNFVHSSMPYADRYAEKQAKLLRMKVNRKHILDRCEKLLASKLKKDTLLTEAKQSRDNLDLLRLAIEQRRSNIEEKRRQLAELRSHNNELMLKLPRYQKRVTSLGKHAQIQRMELENKVSTYNEQAESLAALRRSRIRQLTKYIFPVYMTYDTSESIEDMEFIGEDTEEEPPKRPQLHIVAPWIHTDGDFSQVHEWLRQDAELAGCLSGAGVGRAARVVAALALCAQLLALLAWALDARLPHTISLNEYCNWRVSASGVSWRARRLSAAGAALCARAALPPPHTHAASAPHAAHATPAPPHALAALHTLVRAANTDDPMLGRVESWMSSCEAAVQSVWADAVAALGDLDADDTEPPEHLHWPETMEIEELSCTPPTPAPAPSLLTSFASMWRVFK